ncbi:HNH endonuclease family protein [Pseudonocardia bannensis]|uniref:HNH endonuclease family protein n=1 Tax=Pseudonocardia bannensis TaxID=630973 RepID=UPI0028A709CE|nr:HNH endonuclease family protein [Pseudonocardia bannensis]
MRAVGGARVLQSLLAALVVLVLGSGCAAFPDGFPLDVPDAGAAAPTATGDAAAALATLAVKGRAPKTGYSREQFGQRWADVDRDGCDQRNQVLARDMTNETFRPGSRDCIVLTGTLDDPYTGNVIAFTRGQDTSNEVQIDHVVALSNAWQTGAQQLDEPTRERLGNDPLNLLAVDGPTNGRKGDGDAATWLPPQRGYWCTYVARQVAVKAKYRLWVTAAERDAIAGILERCPGEPLPADTPVAPAQAA